MNKAIFDDCVINPFITGLKILALYREYWRKPNIQRERRHVHPFTHDYQLVGFFDGAAKERAGGSGFILYLNKEHFFQGWMGLASSTNNLSEVTAVWLLLFWAHRMNIKDLKIYGDSLLIIKWL